MILHVIIALIAGTAAGMLGGQHTAFLGGLGVLVIQLVKLLATPLLFFAILDATYRTQVGRRKGLTLLGLSSLNAVVAFCIAASLSLFFPQGGAEAVTRLRMALGGDVSHISVDTHTLSEFFQLKNVLPKSLLEPFLQGQVVSLIVMAMVIGVTMRRMADSGGAELQQGVRTLGSLVSAALQLLIAVLTMVVKIMPLAVFCVVAKAVGSAGLEVFQALGIFVLGVTAAMALHALGYYTLLLRFVARRDPRVFFRAAAEPMIFAMGAASSLATLPVTLRTLEKRLGISAASSRLAACVGTNLNHDGIILYEVMAAFFVAGLYGVKLTLIQKGVIAVTSVMAAVGISGIPDAGLITLSLVLGAVGLPLEACAFLLPVDWWLGRLRATVNVTSDMVVATLLDGPARLEP